MKSVLFCIITLLSGCLALAESSRIQFLTGYGWASRYCYTSSWNYCTDMVKQDARDSAIMDGQNICRAWGGSLRPGYAYCRDNCRPSYPIPDTREGDYVTCNMECDLTCEVREP